MGETDTPHLYDFDIRHLRPRHQAPKPILFILGDTRVPKQTMENIGTFLQPSQKQTQTGDLL